MRETFSEPSSLREMKSWLSSTKKSRSRRVPSRKEKSTTKRDLLIFWILGRLSLSWRDNSLFHRMKLLAFQILRERSTCCRRSSVSNNRKPNIFMTSFRSHLMSTDGESLRILTQRLMRWFKRSNLCKRDSLSRLRKSPKKMSSFRRKRSSILSSRTFWLSRVALRLLRNFRCISRTSRREQTSWRKWLRSWRTTNPR